MRRLLILLMLVGLCGCASVPTDEGASWVDDLPLTIDSDRPWWQKTLFWAGPGH